MTNKPSTADLADRAGAVNFQAAHCTYLPSLPLFFMISSIVQMQDVTRITNCLQYRKVFLHFFPPIGLIYVQETYKFCDWMRKCACMLCLACKYSANQYIRFLHMGNEAFSVCVQGPPRGLRLFGIYFSSSIFQHFSILEIKQFNGSASLYLNISAFQPQTLLRELKLIQLVLFLCRLF